MFEQILSKIQTIENQEKILAEIDLLLSSLYQDKGLGFDSTLRTKVRSWLSLLLAEEFTRKGVEKEDTLIALKQKILEMDKVYLTLAFEPSYDALKRFSGQVKSYVGESCVINFSYEPRLIGGVEIIYKGEYRDFSFKRIFEKEFERSREQFLELLSPKTSEK